MPQNAHFVAALPRIHWSTRFVGANLMGTREFVAGTATEKDEKRCRSLAAKVYGVNAKNVPIHA